MSAWIVDRAHIDAMVEVAIRGPRDKDSSWSPPFNATLATANALGRMLWLENYKSVSYRYPSDTIGVSLPGPVGLTLVETDEYTFKPRGYLNWANGAHQLSCAEALKAIACYEYQSCEHPEWEESRTKQFCDHLRHALISVLPGYAAAPWGISDPIKEEND